MVSEIPSFDRKPLNQLINTLTKYLVTRFGIRLYWTKLYVDLLNYLDVLVNI